MRSWIDITRPRGFKRRRLPHSRPHAAVRALLKENSPAARSSDDYGMVMGSTGRAANAG